jgi:hypothetical protein
MTPARVRAVSTAVRIASGLVAGLMVGLVIADRGSPGPLAYDDDFLATALYVVLVLIFPALGTTIARRYPDNVIGWLFCFSGIGSGLAASAQLYADIAIFKYGGEFPGGELAAWISSWLFPIALITTPLFLLYLFPDGRPLSRRWRRVVWGTCLLLAVGFFAAALVPGDIEPWNGVANPFGVSGAPGRVVATISDLLELAAIPGILLGVVALVIRMRTSRGIERQQLKWFAFSASIMGIGFALAFFFSALGNQGAADAAFITGAVGLLGIPIASGLAILRYRLYDIDVIINRALVYVVLTAVIVTAYAGGVLLFRTMLDPITGDNDVAIAASTLAVAALFGPARRRIQSFIDRRFYRSRYDAQQTLEGFAQRLRDEVDLDTLSSEILSVVSDTVRPRHASVWLAREAG